MTDDLDDNEGFPKADPDALNECFPAERPALEGNTFEVGLALGGTVSAGAYTAGVLDFLIEALDAWTRAKERNDPSAPTHNVVVSTVAGASGGAINGAILLRAANAGYPYGATAENPFFSAWTSGVSLGSLLSKTPEAKANGFASVFNCAAIDTQAETTIAFDGDGSPRQRSYFADPLRLMVMVGNVTGTPYKIPFKGPSKLSHHVTAHDEILRFALGIASGRKVKPDSRPDELALSTGAPDNWHYLRDAALATSAFPMAFRAREIERPLRTLAYRVTVVSSDKGTPEVRPLTPNWETLKGASAGRPGWVKFICVDGGTINNEPFDHVRTALAGLTCRNEREGEKADRAVIMIDPFSDPEPLELLSVPSAPKLLFPLVMALVQQSRFKPADIALAGDQTTFSRFLIAPTGVANGKATFNGKKAIACGGLGGFLGFLDPRFLEYDFKLGRRNAYEFLRDEFAFPEKNPRVAGWTAAQIEAHAFTDELGMKVRRMIPLMPDLPPPAPLTAEDWPAIDKLPPELAGQIRARLETVLRFALTDFGVPTKVLPWLIAKAMLFFFGKDICKRTLAVLEGGLKDQALLKVA